MRNTMELPEFVRLFPMRKGQLMWLLGAGCSVSAGVPTATDMIWDFKRLLYCSENRRSLAAVPHQADPAFRAKLAHFMSSKEGFPKANSEDEYSFYFERTYPDERERRRYISDMVRGAKPTIGHAVLAELMRFGSAQYIWTTNFDRLIEDAFAERDGSVSNLTVANVDNAEVAKHAISDGMHPILIKLHGDFHSRQLKNTAQELQVQDATLRSALNIAIGRFGLVVCGYSGRDSSVMEALTAGMRDFGESAFPGGLFWISRPGTETNSNVKELFAEADRLGISAHFVEAASFDEFMRDIITVESQIDLSGIDSEQRKERRLSANAVPSSGTKWPVLRMNAFPVVSFPSVCRLVDCEIGGARDLRQVIEDNRVDVIALRKRYGVLCFGSDASVRTAFKAHSIKSFSIHSVDEAQLARDTSLLGLYCQALAMALAREMGINLGRDRGKWVIWVPCNVKDPRFDSLRRTCGLSGVIGQDKVQWHCAATIRLQMCMDRLLLIFEPTIYFPRETVAASNSATREQIKEFRRERSAKTINRELNKLFDAWVEALFFGTTESRRDFRCFSIGDGIDATFTLSRITAFSRRL